MTVDLKALVDPGSIAIIGASDRPGSLGARSVENVLVHSKFDGNAHLISKSKPEIAGRTTFGSIADVPGEIDVAMLVVPAAATLGVLRECAEAGVKFAIVFTSGFGEMGAAGKAAEREMLAIGRGSGMRIYGPNSPGLCNLNKPLGMMFSPSFQVDQHPGAIGLATQGGGIGRCFLQGMERGVGVGLWASTGNEVDLTVADFIRYMADADDLTTIATAMEGIKNGPDFMDAVMYAAERNKPVIALKVGRSEYGARAVASHTGSLSGAVEVNRAALKQAGVVEVDDIDQLIDTASLFARRRPTGTGSVAVYGFSGGGCAMTADAVGAAGLDLAVFGEQTLAALGDALPEYAAINNPVDATSDILTRPEIGAASLLATAEDSNVGVVVYPFPCDYDQLTGGIAAAIVETQQQTRTPIVPIWMSDRLGAGFRELVAGGMTPIGSIERGVAAVRRWADWPGSRPAEGWRPIGPGPRKHARTSTEVRGKELLAAHGITVPRGQLARTPEEAADIARDLGGSVVLKVVSAQITHKSDVGGVVVGLTEDTVAQGYKSIITAVAEAAPSAVVEGVLVEAAADDGVDVLIGVTQDPTFGPVLTFGLGGIYVELFADVSRRLLPLTRESALRMVGETRCSAILDGLRGGARSDVEALVDLLIAISDLVVADHDIQELEMNPVRVHPDGQGVTVLDVVLVRGEGEEVAA
ncbi:acetate--CoA ligase family protein [Nocardia sp. R6R-6]|uniref:acetate--CoA ligase family protein n=1 Tax=Nocardia sp. R6R-6 TaxID=3459303 RepID=UPI00403DCF10